MTKYFSKDTPLASLERMMMSVPGFQKRGGGMMVLCRFHYKKEDVDCAYCQSYIFEGFVRLFQRSRQMDGSRCAAERSLERSGPRGRK